MASLLGVLTLALPASAQEGVVGPQVVRSRGLTTLSFKGTLPTGLGSATDLSVSLRRGERSVKVGSIEVGEGGVFELRIRTARLLADGLYTLEVGATGNETLRHGFRLGEPATAKAAATRLLGWYAGATSTFRQLTAALERRGAFHKTIATRDPKGALAQQELFEAFLDGWRRNLRMARMDLATYQRRVLLPGRPEVGDDLLALVPLLLTRGEEWEKALQPFGQTPGANVAVEAAATRLLKDQDRDATELNAWRAGPLGDPPAAKPPGPGAFRSALGFAITIPQDAEVKAPRSPYDRLEFSTGGVTAIVRVEDRPSETTPDGFVRRLETDAWETWDSYKRLSSQRLDGEIGLRLEFRALYRGQRVAVVQRSLFPTGNHTRVVSLLVFRADGLSAPDVIKTLEASFRTGGSE